MTDATIAAALDPAGDDAAGVARAHANECAECAAALAAAQAEAEEVGTLLQALDHPMPDVDVARLMARARTAGSHAMPAPTPVPTPAPVRGVRHPRRRAHWSRWGIGVVTLGTAAVAAALVPSSPVRAFLQRLLVAPISSRPAPAKSDAPPGPNSAAPRGVAIVPGGTIDVIFRAAQPNAVVHVVTGSGTRVSVEASGDGVTYMVGQDTIVVDNRGATVGEYTVRLPSAARLTVTRVSVEGRRVYERVSGRVETEGTPRGDERYDVPLTR